MDLRFDPHRCHGAVPFFFFASASLSSSSVVFCLYPVFCTRGVAIDLRDAAVPPLPFPALLYRISATSSPPAARLTHKHFFGLSSREGYSNWKTFHHRFSTTVQPPRSGSRFRATNITFPYVCRLIFLCPWDAAWRRALLGSAVIV